MRNLVKILSVLGVLMLIFFLFISKPSVNYYNEEPTHFFDNNEKFIEREFEFVAKVVSVKGIVTDVTFSSPFISVVLDSVLCFSFESEKVQKDIQITDTLSIKGRYEGYDELFEEYSFTDCSVYN